MAAEAAQLPFADQSFDAAMAILSDHHWPDPIAGLRELRRVARRVVVFQFDPVRIGDFWLVRDYLTEFAHAGAGRPSLPDRAAVLEATVTPVPIPYDCADGFFHAYWRRPQAYLDPRVRATTSVWARYGEEVVERVVRELEADLASGIWAQRQADLLDRPEAELGARLLVGG